MAFTKYASLESAQVLGIKGSEGRARTATLDKFADFHDFRTEDGYLYARIRAISSRVNKNNDGWPSVELAGSREIFDKIAQTQTSPKTGAVVYAAEEGAEYGYSTFLGKPIFVDHHNSNPERARGVIVDAKIHVEDHKTAKEHDKYYASAPEEHLPPTWVELLLEVDAHSFPHLAKAIIEGAEDPHRGIDGFSMGCDIERSVCNICKNSAESPDEYCEHVKMKGAEFPDKTGSMKKSYEDCYGIKFFEISAVFDPADETALTRELIQREGSVKQSDDWQQIFDAVKQGVYGDWHDLRQQAVARIQEYDQHLPPEEQGQHGISSSDINHTLYGMIKSGELRPLRPTAKTAQNPLPQSELTKAPEEVNTLREEKICPVCGSTMDSEKCGVCDYVEPPEGFDNPDLQKAQQTDSELDQSPEGAIAQGTEPTQLSEPNIQQTRNPGAIAHVTSEMASQTKTAGKVNVKERPIQTDPKPATDEPQEEILQDENQPTTARTASEFIASAERQENDMSQKTAAEPVPAAKPDSRIDVEGVGGAQDASNEQASKADAQIDVVGKGGTPVTDVSADQENVNVAQGDEYSKNIEGTKTDTWSGTERQTDPVQGDTFPSEQGQGSGRSSRWQIEALDAEPFPKDDEGLSGGNATQGTQPADPVGKADDRVNVLQPVTTPANNSGPTKTWTGTDGNAVTRQQEPVTRETLVGEDNIDLNPGTVRSSKHIFSAFKLADLEVEMGLIDADKKYERVSELEAQEPAKVEASLNYALRVKRSGLTKRDVKTAGRLPSLASATTAKTASTDDSEFGDEALYL